MNKIYFNKVFKGYSPEEVEAFIIKLNNDLQQKQQEFTDVTKRLNSENAEMKKHYDETLSANERLLEENRNLGIEKHNLQNEIMKLSAEKAEAPVRIIEVPVAPIVPVQTTSEDEESKQRYKHFCEQMGEKLLIADARAEEIIKKAQSEAYEIMTKAKSNADQDIKVLVADAFKRAGNIYKMIEEYEKKQQSIGEGLEQIRKHISDSIGEVQALITTDDIME